MGDLPQSYIVAYIVVVFFGIGLHEYAHCKFADMAGDPTPGIYGRVTLNLFKHFEPVGTVMIILSAATGYGIGWGRPAPINPSKMRNPRWDAFVAVIAGPLTNILQATIWAFAFRYEASQGAFPRYDSIQEAVMQGAPLVYWLTFLGVQANLGLAIFNLTPLGLLDGHWIVGLLLPDRIRDKWFWWQRRYGSMVLIGLIIVGQTIGRQAPQFNFFGTYVFPIVDYLKHILLGQYIQ